MYTMQSLNYIGNTIIIYQNLRAKFSLILCFQIFQQKTKSQIITKMYRISVFTWQTRSK